MDDCRGGNGVEGRTINKKMANYARYLVCHTCSTQCRLHVGIRMLINWGGGYSSVGMYIVCLSRGLKSHRYAIKIVYKI